MKTNGAQFSRGLMDHIKILEREHIRSLRKVAMTAWQLLTSQSPVLFGTFRGNWMVGINAINTKIDKDRTGIYPYPDPILRLGDTVYISNALPYANRLESGWSKQAPQGIVAPSAVLLQDAIEKGVFNEH